MNNIQLEKQYPFAKPGLTLQIFTLGFIVVCGLTALFFAAYHAFRLVAEPWQAFFAALVIEAGLIAECLAIINKPRTVAPWLGLAISYIVSGTYNYTQAANAGQGLGSWELWALAFGPLSALAVVSLSFGNELRDYQERVSTWMQTRAMWVNGERQRLEKLTVEQEQRRLEIEAQQKQEQLELEARQEQTRLEAEQKHTEKMARIEVSKNRPNERPKRKSKNITKDEAISLIKQYLADNPNASLSEIGRHIGRPKSTAGNYVSKLIQSGAIHRNGGGGWKVMQ